MNQTQSEGTPQKLRDYVQLAKFLLVLIVPSHQLEEVLGDLEEMMRIAERTLGPQGARKLFIFQIITTLTWFLWQRIRYSKAVRWLIAIVLALLATGSSSQLRQLLDKFMSTLQ